MALYRDVANLPIERLTTDADSGAVVSLDATLKDALQLLSLQPGRFAVVTKGEDMIGAVDAAQMAKAIGSGATLEMRLADVIPEYAELDKIIVVEPRTPLQNVVDSAGTAAQLVIPTHNHVLVLDRDELAKRILGIAGPTGPTGASVAS